MAEVSALYRYPVKGFTPEPQEELRVRPDGRVAGDRVLAFRFASAIEPEQRDSLDYWPKRRGLALMTFPTLARLQLSFDGLRLLITESPSGFSVEAGLDDAGREEICQQVTDWLRSTEDAALLDRPGVLPLRLIGDGATPRFQDRGRGFVSLHGASSAADLGAAVPGAEDSRRYRSNIVITGTPAWAELDWSGRLRIGEVEFSVESPIVRCLATHANPETGERDAPVMSALVQQFQQAEPTLGILLLPTAGGGSVRVGDPVELLG
ncbi:MOSC domain-containing protein [Nesterenkonia alkaliphila]|uniref:MOSC domain-containing protein n=1 Tax=Nesterenkonia alkaliphila TaxID=1463631 RepID=A0A7K1UII5_9MICC|nr:MOSC domain-containing protein [Nesterenkonia alkaliphila]MVT26290.1 MOSC domain-containing protein [Nesterenkonia alkaliphila]GFZ97317.1 molybdenum cofactor sulfurase related protein [Nesterenkonia alkaliphila]